MTTVYPPLTGKLSQVGSPLGGFSKSCALWLQLHHIVITAMMLFVGNSNRLSAQTVYSVNVVGYANLSLLPGKNLIANPLNSLPNNVGGLFGSQCAVDGSYIEKFNPISTNWIINEFSGTWANTNMILNPGEAFFFNNPCSANLTWTAVGEVLQGGLTNIIYAGTNFVASMIPIQGFLSLNLGFTADEGDYISLWNALDQSYTTYSFDGWGWTPEEPYINFGQGFRVLSSRNKLWIKYFSVGDSGSTTNIPPRVLSSPASQTATSGQQATFKVNATGSFPLFFQWQFNNTNMIGATNYSLAISNVQSTDAGQYCVVITNAFGSATSAVALLSVNVITNIPPSVAINYPTNNSIFSVGTNITINVNAMDTDGTMSRVDFYVGNNLFGSVTNGSFSPCSFVWSNVPQGTYTVFVRGFDNAGESNDSSGIVVNVEAIPSLPVFSFQTTTNAVRKDAGKVAVTICKRGGPSAEVNFSTLDGTARNIVDYDQNQGTLQFAAGDWDTNVFVSITPSSTYKGDKNFSIQLSLPSVGNVIEPSTMTITIIDTGAPTDSFIQIKPAPAASNTNGSLRVYLSPVQATGQWRFAWESTWRDSGSVAGCLEAGNYDVVFKPIAGYQQPATALIPVLNNETNTRYYTSIGITPVGQFSATILPTSVANQADINQRGQWRLTGEVWRNSNEIVSNLLVGYYIVEFKDLPGLVTPTKMQVYVAPNQNNIAEVTYLVATNAFQWDPPPRQPKSLEVQDIANSYVTHYPYGYCGQLQSDAGVGSGFVVRERVVLTAAHMVFNDVTLSHVTGLRWFFQRYAGYYEPLPKSPRGWYLLEGYAAQRTNDASPGISSPASQDLDAAALYFTEPAGRGGCGGYLVSQTNSTEWLMTVSNKTLVGYPILGINSSDIGVMHATTPDNLIFETFTNHVFTSTSFRSYPGNSGGPLCVLHTNGYYYPAGIYLGGTAKSVVRAIDSSVAKLIASADLSSYDDQNHTGGGTIKVINPSGINEFNPGFVQVILGPPLALARGGAWRVSPDYPAYVKFSTYTTNQTKISVQNGAFAIEFNEVSGFRSPTGQPVQVIGGQTSQILANYQVKPPNMKLLSSSLTNLMIWGTNGTEGTEYRIEYSTNLNQFTNWFLHTNLTLSAGTNSVQLPMPNNDPKRFYRALWVP